jgi:prepilin-type N-terminal cleavage/methylation domain-containing protein
VADALCSLIGSMLKINGKVRIIKGFTLIELLVVISIIGILAAFAIFGMSGAFQSSRDAQRKSDLRQYQNALETYANNNDGLYPRRDAASGQPDSVLCGDLGLTNCPTDPLYDAATGSPVYSYQTETCGSPGDPCAANYVLWAELEDTSNGDYWVYCSNGKSGYYSNAPGFSGIPPSPAGTCPF